jgi:hypothetical protein
VLPVGLLDFSGTHQRGDLRRIHTMGRKSKLTDKQWSEIDRRLLNGESARALGREFAVSEAAIRKRLGAQQKEIKHVANQLVSAETAFSALSISSQIGARTLADRLKSISDHLASGAEIGAARFHRLQAIASSQIDKIDDADPFGAESLAVMKGMAVYNRVANESAEPSFNLLAANKDMINEANKPKTKDVLGFEVIEY